jgi:hypothetical protein
MSAPLEARLAHRLLADRLEAIAAELSEQTIADMYKDPFWHARFGAPRADKHGRQDGHFHVSYLAEALRAGDAGVMERYARWLQQVLTTRGMCSRHLAEHFDRLGQAITARGLPDAVRAIEVLAAASAALRYDAAAPRAIQDRAAAIAGGAGGGPGGAGGGIDEQLAVLVSYLADAVALARPALFAAHVGWLAGFLAERGASGGDGAGAVAALLERLREGVLHEVPEHREVIEPALDLAATALRERRPSAI